MILFLVAVAIRSPLIRTKNRPIAGDVLGSDGCHGASVPVDLQIHLRPGRLRRGMAVDHHFDLRH